MESRISTHVKRVDQVVFRVDFIIRCIGLTVSTYANVVTASRRNLKGVFECVCVFQILNAW